MALVISDTPVCQSNHAIMHTRPFMLDDLEAMHLLIGYSQSLILYC